MNGEIIQLKQLSHNENHQIKNIAGGILLHRQEVNGYQNNSRFVHGHGKQHHQEELQWFPVYNITDRQPCYRRSQNLTQISEREVEPKPHENDHGKGIIACIFLKRLKEKEVCQQCDC